MNNIFKVGFTLAEVLITLAIIGVIASMTLPAIITKTKNAEIVVALKKSYSALSQAYYSISGENGGIQNALSAVTNGDKFANVFIQKFRVAKNCGSSNALDSGCIANTTYKCLGGSDCAIDFYSTFLANDNISYSFLFVDKNCSTNYNQPSNTSSPLYNTCGMVVVDVNGPNKGPSIWGRDTFKFYITKKGIIPAGAYPDGSNCLVYGNGESCAYKVLKEDAINY